MKLITETLYPSYFKMRDFRRPKGAKSKSVKIAFWSAMGIYVSLALMLFVWSSLAVAVPSPMVQMKQTSNQMLKALKQNKVKIKNNPDYTENLARKILLPHVDVKTMSRLVLGRDAWTKADTTQRHQFTDQFTTFMIRTYSTALSSYSNESIEFLPMRGNYQNKQRVQIKSKIIQEGGPSIPVNYRLVLRGQQWKLYDINVDGISLVRSFRSQFRSELNKNGINGLILAMKKHNSK